MWVATKEIPYLHMVKEDNPFMGFRAVRLLLANPDQYKVQLRALLRASAFGDVKIMIPLVTASRRSWLSRSSSSGARPS